MATCPRGHPVGDDDQFCMECGASLATRIEEPQEPPAEREGLWADRQPLLIACGGALMMLSALLPWFTSALPGEPTTYENAFRVDGVWGAGIVVVALGAAAVLVGVGTVMGVPTTAVRMIAVLVGTAALVVAIHDGSELIDRAAVTSDRSGESEASLGTGIYVLATGGVLAVVGAFMRSPRPSRERDPAR